MPETLILLFLYYLSVKPDILFPYLSLSFYFILFYHFGVKKDRLANIAKYWMSKGVARPENLCGARNIARNQTRREAVQNHIQSFSCRASHYARRSAPGRKYLPTDLNVKKMHEQNDEQVTYALYYSVFMYNFNLAIGHPAVDICSTCLKSKFQLKNPSITDQEKQ